MLVEVVEMVWLAVLLPLSLLCCLSALPASSSSQAIHSQSSCLSTADMPELPRCWVWGKKEPLTGWKQVVTRRRALRSIRCITGASGTFRLHKQTTQGIGPPSWVPENEWDYCKLKTSCPIRNHLGRIREATLANG